MKRSMHLPRPRWLPCLAAPALAAILTTFSAAAAAQGTMTPSQPSPEPAATPSEPPPPVAPALPATASNPSAAGAASEASTEPAYEPRDAPKARTGFQMAIRTGVAIPLGDLEKDSKMSDVFGPQVPITIDIGGKVIPQLFLGAYLGLAFGGAAGNFSDACERNNLTCVGVNVRIGAQIQYHILPDAKLNPWVGYGIGYEAVGLGAEQGNRKFSAATGGVEFAHLMAGLDFRLTRGFGIGPFVDFAIGQYSRVTTETTVNGVTTKLDGEIRDTALHQWLTLGAKFTIFP